jgi:DNA polymerase-4
LAAAAPSPGPAAAPAAGGSPRRFVNALKRRPGDVFLVDLDSFYVSVERVRDPALLGRPVIVGGKPGERGVVACASYEARAAGIRAGMPLFHAAALAPRGTVFLHGDHPAYMDASRRVMTLLERFSPRVEPVSLDEAYLDRAGWSEVARWSGSAAFRA